jgi:hypothetical protein
LPEFVFQMQKAQIEQLDTQLLQRNLAFDPAFGWSSGHI